MKPLKPTPQQTGRIGGLTSAANMTPTQRSQRSRAGGEARAELFREHPEMLSEFASAGGHARAALGGPALAAMAKRGWKTRRLNAAIRARKK